MKDKTTLPQSQSARIHNRRILLDNGKSCQLSLVAIVDTSEKDHWLFLKNPDNEILISAQYGSREELDLAVLSVNSQLAE